MSTRPRWLVHDGLRASVERNPGRRAVVAEDGELTYAELFDLASRLGRGLQDLGLRRGDRVVILMENSWQCAASIFAVLFAGGVFVVLNPDTKSEKLGYVLDDSEATFLITQAHLVRTVAATERPLPSLQAVLSTGPTDDASGRELIGWSDVAAAEPLPRAVGTIPLDLASLIYTSGTTGEPKGVMMTHRSIVFTTESVSTYLRLDENDRIFNVLPLAFGYGLYQLLMAVELSATVVLERSFTFSAKTVRRAAELEVTVFPGVPTMFSRLLAHASSDAFALPAVRRVTNAGAAFPPHFLPGVQKIFPNALMFLMYGLTECKRASYLEPELVAQKPRSVGKAIPGTETFVLRPDGSPVEPGEVGILHVRGPHVMAGYWRQPELSAHMLRDGPIPGEKLLCTHDSFTVDDEGFLYFVGRSDEIIKSAGQKVSPVEVEEALYAIPGVQEAAVVGVPDPLLGEAIYAYVACADATLTEADMKRACRERLEGFMVPAHIIIQGSLPKTSTGKIRKEALRDAAIATAARSD